MPRPPKKSPEEKRAYHRAHSLAWRNNKIAAGLCPGCGNTKPIGGLINCFPCRQVHAQKTKHRKQAAKDAKLASFRAARAASETMKGEA